MKIDEKKFGRALFYGIVIVSVLAMILLLIFLRILGYDFVSRKEYKETKELQEKYGKLEEMDDLISRYSVSGDDGFDEDALLKARAASLGDEYTEYMTKKEAAAWKEVMEEVPVSSKMLEGDTGYIRIASFGEKTSDEFEAELAKLEAAGAADLVIDLRDNGGGYMDQAIKIADRLLPECTITYTEDKNGKKKYYNSDEKSVDLGYALIVNKGSASASEILSAAVKDNKGGKIVGVRTYGKGLVQKEFPFKDGSILKLTVAKYYSPKGNVIDGKGVAPDIEAGGGKAPEDPGLSDPAVKAARDAVIS